MGGCYVKHATRKQPHDFHHQPHDHRHDCHNHEQILTDANKKGTSQSVSLSVLQSVKFAIHPYQKR